MSSRGVIAAAWVVVVFALATGCSAAVVGSGAGAVTTTTEADPSPEPTRESTQDPTSTPSPTPFPIPVVDEGAPAQYCDDPFPGALGKPMLAVVVETPSGRLTCDQAAAVLFDYYAQRRDPTAGLPPLVVGSLSCNQVAEPSLPQVVCADRDDLVYSMWPQT